MDSERRVLLQGWTGVDFRWMADSRIHVRERVRERIVSPIKGMALEMPYDWYPSFYI